MRAVSAKVPWRLLAKAALAAVAWHALPYWMFVLLALGLYFVPVFRPFPLFIPFLVLLFLATVLPADYFGAAFVGVSLFLTLGVKDLVLAKRDERYAVLVVVLLFGAGMWFFADAGTGGSLFGTFVLGALFFALTASYVRVLGEDRDLPAELRLHLRASALVSALLLAEWTWALLLLPLSETYRFVLYFIPAALLVSFVGEYAANGPSRRSTLTHASLFIGSLVLLLASVQWGI
jgi:hypothetical protein